MIARVSTCLVATHAMYAAAGRTWSTSTTVLDSEEKIDLDKSSRIMNGAALDSISIQKSFGDTTYASVIISRTPRFGKSDFSLA